MMKALLITGGTGKQGGAVIDTILSSSSRTEFDIFALTRDPNSTKAKRLAGKSSAIKLIRGNLDNPEAVFAAVEVPVWGVFSVQVPLGGGATPEKEERQAKALVNAALIHDVKHFVYTSVDRGRNSDSDPTEVPQFASKHRSEKYLQEKCANSSMTWTILRPTAFMENFSPDFVGKVVAATIRAGLPAGRSFQLISTIDIGYFAVQAFINPEEYKSRAIGLAGDELTFEQIKGIYKQKVGKKLPQTFWIVGWLLVKGIRELRLTFEWTAQVGSVVDIQELKKIHPELLSFSDWLEKMGRCK